MQRNASYCSAPWCQLGFGHASSPLMANLLAMSSIALSADRASVRASVCVCARAPMRPCGRATVQRMMACSQIMLYTLVRMSTILFILMSILMSIRMSILMSIHMSTSMVTRLNALAHSSPQLLI